ncbi:MAG: leucine-rich repeat protein, partial [Victivallales bacterium]|nr:leucine-rich repeat protein [Victivallales bacterium]
MTTISVGTGNSAYISVDGLLLNKDGTILIHGVNGDVTIPDSVMSIKDRAFEDCNGLTSVTIPDSVTSVGRDVFVGCGGSIFDTETIPGVKLVDGWAVGYTDSNLGHLNLNDVRGIGDYAFYNCNGLTNVAISEGVTRIGQNAFKDCAKLNNVTFYGDVPSGVEESWIFLYAKLIRYPKRYADSYAQFVPDEKFGGYILSTDEFLNIDGSDVVQSYGSQWVGDYDVSHDNEGSMRSGGIGHGESTWIETSVTGAVRVSFWWKASSEGYDDDVFDYACLSVDGVPQGALAEYKLQGVAIGGKTDWTNVVFDVTGAGPHTIRWTYCKDEVDEGDVGNDCVWLDEVSFDPLVSLSFVLDGGEGRVPDCMAKFAQTRIVLPAANGFGKPKHRFVGWSDGENTYAAGAEYIVPDSNVVFSAVWAANTLAAPRITSADVLNGGTLTTAFATIRITADAGTAIHYTMDGSEPTAESALYSEPFIANGQAVTIRAVAVRDDYFDSPIAKFSFTRKPFSAAECLNIEGRMVSTGEEDAAWVRVLDAAAHDGVAALRSGVIGDGGTSSVEMTVRGAGEIG